MMPIERRDFKKMFAPLIRDTFDIGLRNDVYDQETNSQTAGWKGIQAVDLEKIVAIDPNP
jgi:hypothetical protein